MGQNISVQYEKSNYSIMSNIIKIIDLKTTNDYIIKKHSNNYNIMKVWNSFLSIVPHSVNFDHNVYHNVNGKYTIRILNNIYITHYKSSCSLSMLISIDNLNDGCYVGFNHQQFLNYKDVLSYIDNSNN